MAQHALSLPIALLFTRSIKDGFRSLQLASTASPFLTPDHQIDDLSPLSSIPALDWAFFRPYLILAGNLLTQLICVSGVNQLTSVCPPYSTLAPRPSCSRSTSVSPPSRRTSSSRRARRSACASACGGSATAGTRSSDSARAWSSSARYCTLLLPHVLPRPRPRRLRSPSLGRGTSENDMCPLLYLLRAVCGSAFTLSVAQKTGWIYSPLLTPAGMCTHVRSDMHIVFVKTTTKEAVAPRYFSSRSFRQGYLLQVPVCGQNSSREYH